jgi:glycosyltransferase involved in cell wall biosynthesis
MNEINHFQINNPLVSVLIPTYNCGQWLGQAIDSVLAQTYKHLEIIVVDDGSTDNTAKLLEEKYKDVITYIYQPNCGLGNARNTGIKHAKGELLAFLDADDVMLPEKISCQVEYASEHPDYVVIYCNFWCIFDDKSDIWQLPSGDYQHEGISGELFETLLSKNIMVPSSVLISKKVLAEVGNFYEEAQGVEDWDLWLRIAGKGYLFGYIDARLLLYRVRTGSMSHNLYNMRLHTYRIFAHVKEEIPLERLQLALAQTNIAASFEFGVARANFEKKRYRVGFRQVLISLKVNRRHRLPYSLFCLIYLLLLPFLGYARLEKLIIYLIERKPNLRI